MNTFANAGFAASSAPAEPAALEIDGSRAQVIAAAVPAFAGQAPDAQLGNTSSRPRTAWCRWCSNRASPKGSRPHLAGAMPTGRK